MRRVFLLEDDVDLRALLSAALSARGIQVEGASSSAEAAAALSRAPADLLVVDGQLPDGTGEAFIQTLRGQGVRTQVVYLTGVFRDLQTFRRLTAELGVALVVYKPFEVEGLVDRLLPMIRQVPAPGASGADAAPAAVLAELKRQYRERLPSRIEELGQALAAGRADPSRLEAARLLAHRLRGTAGSYGVPQVGEIAGRLEDLLAAAPQHEGSGRQLWYELETALADARLAASNPKDPPGAAPEPSGHPSRALLVVDDDADFLEVARAAARRMSVRILTALGADEALQRAGDHALLGAVLDVNLQGERSFGLARRLRQTRANGEIPIAFISVDKGMERRIEALEAGASRFIDKPISAERLAEVIQHFVGLADREEGRVLALLPDAAERERLAELLRAEGAAVETLGGSEGLLERLERRPPDVLLLDLEVPDISGADICRVIRSSDRWQLLTVLAVADADSREQRLAAFRAGATDVLTRPFLVEELTARVGIHLERARLLRERADKDPLTGLMLRRVLLEALDRMLALCTREGTPLSLVLLDVDHFKSVNDRFGHLAGDLVLRELGELLRRRFRAEDLRGRWGGEEFLLVFPGQNLEVAAEAARRLLEDFRGLEFGSDRGEPFSASFTAGVAGFPDDGVTAVSLLRRADALLYEGKRRGRSQVVTALA